MLKIQSLLHLCSEYYGDKDEEEVGGASSGEKTTEGSKRGAGGESGGKPVVGVV